MIPLENSLHIATWRCKLIKENKITRDKNLGEIHYVTKAITMHSHNYNFSQLFERRFIEGEADFFITGVKPTIINAYLRTCFRELKYYIQQKNILGIPKIFIRNLYSVWGYLKGFQSAQRRVRNNDTNLVSKSYQ